MYHFILVKAVLLFAFPEAVYSEAYTVPIELVDKLESTQFGSSAVIKVAVLQLTNPTEPGPDEQRVAGNKWPTGYLQRSVANILKETRSLDQSITVVDQVVIQGLTGPSGVPPKIDTGYFQRLYAVLGVTHLVFFQHDYNVLSNEVSRTTRLFELESNSVIFTHRDKWNLHRNILPSKIDMTIDQCVESLNAITCDFRISSEREGQNSLVVDSVYFWANEWVDSPSVFHSKGLMNAAKEVNMSNGYVTYVSAAQRKYPSIMNDDRSIVVAVVLVFNGIQYFYRSPPFLYSH